MHNALLVVARSGDLVDGIDVRLVDPPLSILTASDVAEWVAKHCDPDKDEYVLVELDLDEESTLDEEEEEDWPRLAVTLSAKEVAAVEAAARGRLRVWRVACGGWGW